MPGVKRRLKVLLLSHKIRASSLEIFRLIFFIIGLTLDVDPVIQAPRLLTPTPSQGALFLLQMNIQIVTIVLDNIYTGKSVTIETPDKWYQHETLPVVDTPKVTILWNFHIRTDRTIQANRPDIVIKHKQNKTGQLIDMSLPYRWQYFC